VVAYVLIVALIVLTCVVAAHVFGTSSSKDQGCAATSSCGGAPKPPANLPS